jgi:hypothetical protein
MFQSHYTDVIKAPEVEFESYGACEFDVAWQVSWLAALVHWDCCVHKDLPIIMNACHLASCFELCREDIEKSREAERLRIANADAMETDEAAEEVDRVPCITRAHFEEAMKYARRSVSDSDIRRYAAFANKLQQSRGFGSDFKFPGDSAAGVPTAGAAAPAAAAAPADPFASTAAADDDEDDLYS